MEDELNRLRKDVRTLVEALGPVAQQLGDMQKNQHLFTAAIRSVAETLDELKQSQDERNARVLNLAARQHADHLAWVAALQAMGVVPDTEVFHRERERFKAEHGHFYVAMIWDQQPDWLLAIREHGA